MTQTLIGWRMTGTTKMIEKGRARHCAVRSMLCCFSILRGTNSYIVVYFFAVCRSVSSARSGAACCRTRTCQARWQPRGAGCTRGSEAAAQACLVAAPAARTPEGASPGTQLSPQPTASAPTARRPRALRALPRPCVRAGVSGKRRSSTTQLEAQRTSWCLFSQPRQPRRSVRPERSRPSPAGAARPLRSPQR